MCVLLCKCVCVCGGGGGGGKGSISVLLWCAERFVVINQCVTVYEHAYYVQTHVQLREINVLSVHAAVDLLS